MAIWHLVARTARRGVELTEWGLASRLWCGLRRAFPEALGSVVMPDHLHVIDEGMERDEARRRLSRVLSRATYGMGRGVWAAVPVPDRVHEPKLARTIRYVALNPCREELVADPLEWTWSTHRDVVGAVAEPWVAAGRLEVRLRPRMWGSSEAWHRFVSSDFSVAPGGTPPPRRIARHEGREFSIVEVIESVTSALRLPPDAIRRRGSARRLFVHLAVFLGWRDTALLARTVDTSRRSIAKILHRRPGRPEWEAAMVCLGDRRLRSLRPSRRKGPERGTFGGYGRPSRQQGRGWGTSVGDGRRRGGGAGIVWTSDREPLR